MMCSACGLQWDKDDKDKPECNRMQTYTLPPATGSGKQIHIGTDRGSGDCEAVCVRQGNQIIAQEVSKPGKYLTPEQWKEIRRALGDKC